MSDPDIKVLAAYVLRIEHRIDDEGKDYPAPGSFYGSLVETLMVADAVNRRRLAVAFPVLASMVTAYKEDWNGLLRLKRAYKSGEWTG